MDATDADPRDSFIGQVVDGRFEVVSRLGEGGMSTVYRAVQRSMGRDVAIKVLDRKSTHDKIARRRFQREAKLASRLSQPNTVGVIDVGQTADRRMFLAMELVEGRTLSEVVRQEGPFSLARAVHVGVQICDALAAAHAAAIVHRDLKPANVMILDAPVGRDLVKVLDFGLAKSIGDDDPECTQAGYIVGTPRYLAPELAMGHPATPRTDLYGVGVLLAEITSGKRLFHGANIAELIWQKTTDIRIPDEVPASLRPLIERLVAPDPIDRPASAAEVRAALAALAAAPAERLPAEPEIPIFVDAVPEAAPAGKSAPTQLVQPPPARASRWRSVAWIAAVVGALAVGAAVGSAARLVGRAGTASAATAVTPATPHR